MSTLPDIASFVPASCQPALVQLVESQSGTLAGVRGVVDPHRLQQEQRDLMHQANVSVMARGGCDSPALVLTHCVGAAKDALHTLSALASRPSADAAGVHTLTEELSALSSILEAVRASVAAGK